MASSIACFRGRPRPSPASMEAPYRNAGSRKSAPTATLLSVTLVLVLMMALERHRDTEVPIVAETIGGRAIVLGGGGVTGIAWEIGVLAGLLDAGVDLAADAVFGTSAGSFVGAALAAGADIEQLYAAQQAPAV